MSVLYHGVVCRPYSEFLSKQVASSRRMLQPPPPGSHPVLIARSLLLLGTFLQGIPQSSVDRLAGLGADHHTIMRRAFDTATRLVTSDDELIATVEGIECVMIESMYLNDSGNLRRAWLANRRAMALAQMMGLHTGARSPRVVLERKTWERIDPDYMWFRIVLTDRYLSLMLGLPQGSPDNDFASPEALGSCPPVERLERMEAVAAGLILQRNSTDRTDLAATYEVGRMLQDAAALMPPQWWVMTARRGATTGNDAEAFEESVRLMNQFAYHHLLVQLHLPYMILPSSYEPGYDYSKMTAASASREIVARYVSFRSSTSSTAYCRGIDFIVFTASTTLCLAHIEACRQSQGAPGRGVRTLQSLRHQRLGDRGLLEHTLEIMESMAQTSHDAVARDISSILRPLLAIEDNSSKGGCYNIYASTERNKLESQCLGDTSEALHALRIQIPYFGTVQIEHQPTVSDNGLDPTLPEGRPDGLSEAQIADASLVSSHEPISTPNRDNWSELASTAQPVGYRISTSQPANTDWQTVPSCIDLAHLREELEPANWHQHGPPLDSNRGQDTFLLVPGLETDVNDWALQGVDMALFNNLTRGSSGSAEADTATS